VDPIEKERLTDHFNLGFRELQLLDIQRSDEADIRMGTFIQAAAFIDALSLAYSASDKHPERKWKCFMERYFPPEYAPVVAAYGDFRCLLLHNSRLDNRSGSLTTSRRGICKSSLTGDSCLTEGGFPAAAQAASVRLQVPLASAIETNQATISNRSRINASCSASRRRRTIRPFCCQSDLICSASSRWIAGIDIGSATST
jgi:hypothetical protein